MSMMVIQDYLKAYLCERPLFLSLIRAKEAFLYQKYFPFKKPVLDIGCGDGFFAKVTFSKRHPEPCHSGLDPESHGILKQVQDDVKSVQDDMNLIDIGLDVKESRINEARKLGIYKKLVIYDGVKIPFPDNYFSTIVSNCVLEHVTELEAVLEEAYRVLKPGGVFLTTVMAKPWEDYLFGTKLLGVWYQNWMRKKQVHLNLYNHKNWDDVFKKSGFRIVDKIGYLDKKASRLVDICHYLSIGSLVTYKLFGKWVIFPELSVKFYPLNYLTGVISKEIKPDQAGAIFYKLTK